MRLIRHLLHRLDAGREQGFTMLITIGAMALVLTVSVVAFTATNAELGGTSNDALQKQAYAAAQAGVQQYLFNLDANNQYWSQCVPSPADGINQVGSTANTRLVPGSSTQSYAIELMPAAGQSTYTQCSASAPAVSMIAASGSGGGSLRIRADGFAGGVKRSIVAQLRESTFLDFVWFTQYETDDPSVQLISDGCTPTSCPNSSWSASLATAQAQCGQYYRQGRTSTPFYTDSGGTRYSCDSLFFINSDNLRGPVYTDDQFAVCGSPTFGRPGDPISFGAPSPAETNAGNGSCSATANNATTPNYNAPILAPPTTNSALQNVASANGLLFTGPTCITINGTTISAAHPPSGSSCASGGLSWTTYPWPANGVVYVQNSGALPCTQAYDYTNPVYVTNAANSGCGIAYVQGTYNQALTLGTANDLVVTGNTVYNSNTGNALLGLVANGFVRVDHTCGSGVSNLAIDGALFSVQHSIIVDDYKCGSPMGSLNITGSIAQKFRGGVGTFSGASLSTGYSKNYVYDDRLRYEEPPSFLDPVNSQWHVIRENECVTTGNGTGGTTAC